MPDLDLLSKQHKEDSQEFHDRCKTFINTLVDDFGERDYSQKHVLTKLRNIIDEYERIVSRI